MENNPQASEEPVSSVWERVLHGMLAVFLLVSIGLLAHYYPQQSTREVQQEVQGLRGEVQRLKQEQAMPALVLNRYRNSIAYIHGVYDVAYDGESPPILRARVSGTGFVVAEGLLATNRHVAEPWYEDPDSAVLIRKGAHPHLERLIAFFPGLPEPVNLIQAALSAQGDLAVLRIENLQSVGPLRSLPLAEQPPDPGELVSVVGYPMGVLGMVAKSPAAVYERLALRHDDQNAASELAALSLIRPSATCGHLGDVVGDKLIYDAPTAHGASGGPVFNSQGEVIGVNAAYIDGFSGGTLGVSVRALRPLIQAAQSKGAKR
ncbi:MAG TPA: serine protease [Terriglobales bacterium]|nr:serine protease [Terriglobales bacterium]